LKPKKLTLNNEGVMKITLRHLDQEKVIRALDSAIPLSKKTKANESGLMNSLAQQDLIIDVEDYDSICGYGAAAKIVHQQRLETCSQLKKQAVKTSDTIVAIAELEIAIDAHKRSYPVNVNRFHTQELTEPCSISGPVKFRA
jgi:hypothetical protein